MPKYMTRVSFTREGVKGLQKEKATHRRDAVAKLVESAGGKLETFYFAFGQDDGIAIYDLPDNVTAASLSIAANAAGQVHLTLSHYLNRQMIGPSLNQLTVNCNITYSSDSNADPAAYDDQEWISSPYTFALQPKPPPTSGTITRRRSSSQSSWRVM